MRVSGPIAITVAAWLAAVAACDGDGGAPGGGGLPDAPPADCISCSPVIETTSGPVRGSEAGSTWAFLGIPYAAPPVGSRRFRPPEPPAPWTAVLDAARFGPACPQLDHGELVGDEDCLQLNVWAPAGDHGPLPVMVWVHGGENEEGSSGAFADGGFLYDGSYLAEHGPAVVVTINYRLGSLGFLTHPALDAESDRGVSGNYALLDQIAALRWVADNAAAFGGDPERVLAFGHSAGANDLCSLVTSPLARGLFSRAMLLSASGDCYAATRDEALFAGAGVAADPEVDCAGAGDVAACLRQASVDALVRAPVNYGGNGDSGFNAANVDGHVLTDHPLAVLRRGDHNQMPIVVSSTADEFTTLGGPSAESPAELERLVGRTYGDAFVDSILARYQGMEPADAWQALQTDDWFTCPARADASAIADSQDAPVWRTLFAYTFEQGGDYRHYRAGHGMELFFGFHSFGDVPAGPLDLAFADRMVTWWTQFADTGDPDPPGVEWPEYDPARDNTLRDDAMPDVVDGIRSARCNTWDDYWGR